MEREHGLLSSIIGQEIRLSRAGREWKALCPFHDEKSPSFYVNDEKGFYHCFGCSAHGDAAQWEASAGARRQRASMALAKIPRSVEASKIGGGKLNRSETVTVRLDPKLNYLCELAARSQRRTKSSFIEWAVAEALGSVNLPEVREQTDFGEFREVCLQQKSSDLWEVDEPDRVVTLALIAPALLTHEEQLVWRLVRENGFLWKGKYDRDGEWVWTLSLEHLIRNRLREHWAAFQSVARGELDFSVLPKWNATRDPDLDDVPF